MSTIDEIIELIKKLSSEETIEPTTDIFKDAGLVGDDFDEMIEKFALKYSVDMTSYIWYFHTDEEGLSIGSFFLFSSISEKSAKFSHNSLKLSIRF